MAVRIIPLGGLGEVGMNALLIEEDGRRVLVDCGVMFPNDQVLGVEVAIPDLTYVREAGGLDAVLVTHGHEDHIGGLPSLLREFPVPVHGTRFTLRLVRERLTEHGIDVPLREVEPRRSFAVGPFQAEPLRVTHSIPDAVGYAIETGEGFVVHTGDYKIDLTPVGGERLDLGRFTEYGRAGVVALLSDSTNAEREGWSVSEAAVAEGFVRRFREAKGRILVALFASNVHRVQSVLDLAAGLGRKVVLAGRSLANNARISQELGLLSVPAGVLVDDAVAAALPPERLVVLASGAQGEPNSALARMSVGDYHGLRIEPGDTVIFSSRAIPGNEIAVGQLVNRLAKRGAVVIDRALDAVHASGHAQAEEQKILLDAVRPEHFVPIHGEYRMLLAHARTALRMGVPASGVFVVEDGEALVVEGGRMRLGEPVPSGRVWLDARGGLDVSELVLREREQISGQGLLMVLVVADRKTGEILRGPEILGRGVAHLEEGGPLFEAAVASAREALSAMPPEARTAAPALEDALSHGVRRVFRREPGRRPAVLPLAVLL
ncbi:ribonuclease [Sorangium cellulosum]|uniref:Ribonuclease J n=1 Tax=Sorangium cellulosum TaxID=56 RepID=A0A4P2PYU7_SORCE|nr:ribonuclease J [Sorangium cellulosum]AUX21871.1 ribonuclease [Sorangium cellulosum]